MRPWFFSISAMVLVFIAVLPGCNEDSTTMTPPTPTPLAPVTNLRAYSANAITVGLTWTGSTDAGQADFVEYQIRAVAGSSVAATTTSSVDTASVTNLVEGVVYTFQVFAVASSSSQTYLNSDTVTIQWSPARRLTMDMSAPIDVYEISSTLGGSGLQFYDGTSGGPRVLSISVSGGFQDVIDVLMDMTTAGVVVLESAHLNPLLVGQARATKFSSIEVPSDTLDVGQTAPPALATYDRDLVTIGDAAVATGKIFYAISNDSNYVRIFVKRDPSSGTLLYGASPNRYVRVQLSYQGTAGVPFAKR